MPIKLNTASGGGVILTGANTASDKTITVPAVDGTMQLIQQATAVSASGTSVDFTGIPSWAKRITVMFNGVSLNGSSAILVQIGDSGGIENTGYNSSACNQAGTVTSSTAGFVMVGGAASLIVSGIMNLSYLGSNNWVEFFSSKLSTSASGYGGGDKQLSDTLDRVRITTVNGTDTLDAGTINIMYEG